MGACPEPPSVIYTDEPCEPFNPNDYEDLWYKSSCIAYVPLNVGKKNCGTAVEIPAGWIIAPVDENFNRVISTYSNNWPAGCYQGTTQDGYGSFEDCVPTHTTYTTFINQNGQVLHSKLACFSKLSNFLFVGLHPCGLLGQPLAAVPNC